VEKSSKLEDPEGEWEPGIRWRGGKRTQAKGEALRQGKPFFRSANPAQKNSHLMTQTLSRLGMIGLHRRGTPGSYIKKLPVLYGHIAREVEGGTGSTCVCVGGKCSTETSSRGRQGRATVDAKNEIAGIWFQGREPSIHETKSTDRHPADGELLSKTERDQPEN